MKEIVDGTVVKVLQFYPYGREKPKWIRIVEILSWIVIISSHRCRLRLHRGCQAIVCLYKEIIGLHGLEDHPFRCLTASDVKACWNDA